MSNVSNESDEDGIKRRFVEEFEKIEEPKNKISALIGVTPQTLTNLTKGYNMASILVLSRIKAHFPVFDVNYVVSGFRSTDDSEALRNLRAELAREKSIANALIAKDKGAITSPGVDRRHLRASATQMMSAVRHGAKFTPDRDPESRYVALTSAYLQRVRMQ